MMWQNDYLHLADFTETKFDEIIPGDCRARWFIKTVTVGMELVSENLKHMTWRAAWELDVIALPRTVRK